ncbi:pyocin knob domain-containing protein, partial [Thalassovita gelatinovora]
GFYYNTTAGNTPGNNYPISSAGALLVIYDGSTRCVQDYTLYGNGAPRKFVRSNAATGWSPWRELYSSGSLLGSVSQSGGVPDGAVIERGSNANGAYTRWADGTQICTHSLNLGSLIQGGSGTRSAPYLTATTNWTYPAAFSAIPALSGIVTATTGNAYDRANFLIAQSGSATASGNINAIRATDSAVDISPTANLTAIGHWF